MFDMIVADDHPLTRAGLRALVQGHSDLRVTAEASDYHELLRLVERQAADLLLLDLRMPGPEPEQVLELLARSHPDLKVAILSGSLAEGARGLSAFPNVRACLDKSVPPQRLLCALQAVARGETCLNTIPLPDGVQPLRVASLLSADQRRLLSALQEETSTAQAARELQISLQTLREKVADIYDTLNLRHALEDLLPPL